MKKAIIFGTLAGIIILGMMIWWSRDTSGDKSNGKSTAAPVTAEFTPPQIEFMTVSTTKRTRNIPIEGRLKAGNRLELFPEVPGVVRYADNPFREGTAFHEGDIIILIDNEEARYQLHSSRSGFQAHVASLLPDIKLDYPEELESVEEWFSRLDPETTLPPLPEIENTQLNRFLASRGIYDRYYQIRSAETRLRKFVIRAPFSGVLSAAHAEPGQTVGPQFHLGTLIDPDHFILTAAVHRDEAERISIGDRLDLSGRGGGVSGEGVIRRINPSVQRQTQMVEVYLDVQGDGLREGMYLRGDYPSGSEEGLARVPKSALLRTGHVYVRQNGVIRLVPVEITDVEKDRVWVKGLSDGDQIVRQAGPALGGLVTE